MKFVNVSKYLSNIPTGRSSACSDYGSDASRHKVIVEYDLSNQENSRVLTPGPGAVSYQ